MEKTMKRKQRDGFNGKKFTTTWDWKAQPDVILAELQRVLKNFGVTLEETEGEFLDSVYFRFDYIQPTKLKGKALADFRAKLLATYKEQFARQEGVKLSEISSHYGRLGV